MTELAKSMFNIAWGMSGPLNPLYWINMGTELLEHVQQLPPAPHRQSPPAQHRLTASVLDSASSALLDLPRDSPLGISGPLNPLYWINMGTELLKHVRQSSPTQHRLTASVLDSASPALLDLPRDSPNSASPLAGPVRLQGTGWGPMP